MPGPRPSGAEAGDIPLVEADASQLAQVFAALDDPVRLRLLSIVAARGEVRIRDMREPLGRLQPTISHHARVLAEAGLIRGDNRGKWTWWSIVPARIDSVCGALTFIADGQSPGGARR